MILEENSAQSRKNFSNPVGRPRKQLRGTFLCDICLGYENQKRDPLFQCETCKICAHASCILVRTKAEIKRMSGVPWHCSRCEIKNKMVQKLLSKNEQRVDELGRLSESESRGAVEREAMEIQSRMKCSLCPDTYGVLTYIVQDDLWVHFTCVNWFSDISFVDSNPNRLSKSLRTENEKTPEKCVVCDVAFGRTISCDSSDCLKQFHPRCARVKGIIRRWDIMKHINNKIYCLWHLKKNHPHQFKEKDLSVNMAGFPPLMIDQSFMSEDQKKYQENWIQEQFSAQIANNEVFPLCFSLFDFPCV